MQQLGGESGAALQVKMGGGSAVFLIFAIFLLTVTRIPVPSSPNLFNRPLIIRRRSAVRH